MRELGEGPLDLGNDGIDVHGVLGAAAGEVEGGDALAGGRGQGLLLLGLDLRAKQGWESAGAGAGLFPPAQRMWVGRVPKRGALGPPTHAGTEHHRPPGREAPRPPEITPAKHRRTTCDC